MDRDQSDRSLSVEDAPEVETTAGADGRLGVDVPMRAHLAVRDAGAFTQLGDECLEAGFLFCRWNFFFKVANQANADGVLVES